jgi:sulfopyruvate decarboxylase TPP-binding subunit
LTGVEAEVGDIPAAVPMQKLTPEVLEAAEGAPEPMEEATEEVVVLPEAALEVVVRSPEIQDADPSALCQ